MVLSEEGKNKAIELIAEIAKQEKEIENFNAQVRDEMTALRTSLKKKKDELAEVC